MTTHHTDEKKPADGGQEPVVLEGFDALIFRRCGNAVFVSTLGAAHSRRPRCCDAVDAAVSWVANYPRDRLGVELSLGHAEETEGIRHILAFMSAMESSYWNHREPASSVEVAGLGKWIFIQRPIQGPLDSLPTC